MSRLPLDMPDDYPWLPSSTRYPLADLGEQAVRLGSPVTYDRRGEVVWMDVGDRGIAPFNVTGSGGLNSVDVSILLPLHGYYNLKMTAGNTANWLSEISKKISNLSMRRCGLEVAFFLPSLSNQFWIEVDRFDGTNLHRAAISLYAVTQKLRYLDGAGAQQTIVNTGAVVDPYGIYHHLKVVVDFELDEYVRVLYNDQKFDLSGKPVRVTLAADIQQYRIYAGLLGRDTFNDVVYVGHMIVTGNEP